jgi:hypothetical protein
LSRLIQRQRMTFQTVNVLSLRMGRWYNLDERPPTPVLVRQSMLLATARRAFLYDKYTKFLLHQYKQMVLYLMCVIFVLQDEQEEMETSIRSKLMEQHKSHERLQQTYETTIQAQRMVLYSIRVRLVRKKPMETCQQHNHDKDSTTIFDTSIHFLPPDADDSTALLTNMEGEVDGCWSSSTNTSKSFSVWGMLSFSSDWKSQQKGRIASSRSLQATLLSSSSNSEDIQSKLQSNNQSAKQFGCQESHMKNTFDLEDYFSFAPVKSVL